MMEKSQSRRYKMKMKMPDKKKSSDARITGTSADSEGSCVKENQHIMHSIFIL